MKNKLIVATGQPTESVTVQLSAKVLEDLKRVAPTKEMPDYEALMEYYIRQGLKEDLDRLRREERSEMLAAVLEEYGLSEKQRNRIWELIREHPRIKLD
jgi:hypothetical protein